MNSRHEVGRGLVLVALLVVGVIVGGCAGTTSQQPVRWERRTLTQGVELFVADDASPEAISVADQIQREYRSRYITAR